MSKKLTYALTTVDGTLNPNVLHDALIADTDYPNWIGTWDDTINAYKNSLLYVEHDGTNVYLTVPDETDESQLTTKVDAQRT